MDEKEQFKHKNHHHKHHDKPGEHHTDVSHGAESRHHVNTSHEAESQQSAEKNDLTAKLDSALASDANSDPMSEPQAMPKPQDVSEPQAVSGTTAESKLPSESMAAIEPELTSEPETEPFSQAMNEPESSPTSQRPQVSPVEPDPAEFNSEPNLGSSPKPHTDFNSEPVPEHNFEPELSYTGSSIEPPKDEKPKKKKTTLIIVLSVIIVLIASSLIWFFAFYNRPEKIAADAVLNLATSPNLRVVGEQTAKNSSVKTEALSSYTNGRLTANVSNTITTSIGNNSSAEFKLDTVAAPDGQLYLHVDGFSNMFNQPQYAPYKEALAPLVETIKALESEWWQIDVEKAVDNLGLSATDQAKITSIYNCVYDSITADNFKVLGNIYQKNAFLTADKDTTHDGYRLNINSAKLTNFINEFAHSEIVSNAATCINDTSHTKLMDTSKIKDISESDVKKATEEWPEIYAKIGLFDHRITEISTNDHSSSSTYAVSYPKSVEISAPSSYKPISEATDYITKLVEQFTNTNSTKTTE